MTNKPDEGFNHRDICNPHKLKAISVDPQKVIPCMWRNLDLNPLDEELIAGLMQSQQEHGFWGALRGRPVKGGCIEQAFGHHRVEAARRLGIPEIKMEIGSLTDDVMLSLMAKENANQSGRRPGNVLEVVYAATIRLAEVMLFEGEFWQIRQNLPQIAKAFANEDGFLAARGRFENGAGCGRPLIMAYLGKGDPEQSPYHEWEIKEAIATLKMMGELPKIAEKVIVANERTLATIKKQAEQAKREAEKAHEIGDKAKAKAAEGRERQLAARVSAIRETPRLNAEKNPQLYDGECNKLFPKDSQLNAFRTAITSGKTGRFLEVPNQFGFAKEMMDVLTRVVEDPKKVTPTLIIDWVAQHLRAACAKTPEEIEAAREAEWIANARERLKTKCRSISVNSRQLLKQIVAVGSILEKHPECEELYPEVNQLAQGLYDLANNITHFARDCLKIDKCEALKESHDWHNHEGLFADDLADSDFTDYEDITPDTDDKRLIGWG